MKTNPELDKYLLAHAQSVQVMGDLSRVLEQMEPRVAGVRTYVLDQFGTTSDQYRLPFRALFVDAPVPAAASASNVGNVTNPGAGVPIVNLNLAAGWWDITATASLTGTVTAADGNNMFVFGTPGGPQFAPIGYPGIAGANGTVSLKVRLTAAGSVQVLSTAAASGAAAAYGASITATPSQVSQLLTIAGMPLQESAPPSGPGVAIIRRGGSSLVNLRAYAWSLYGGNPGDVITVTALGSPQAPASR